MKAFRSLKAYKFFDGFVRNVWVYECPRTSNLNLRVLYFRGYFHHSLTCDSLLEVYISINGDNGTCILANVFVCLSKHSEFILFV